MVVMIGIDGRCVSGKTTLAAMLRDRLGCAVVHMDDFFLRPEQRSPERLAQPGGNVDRERVEHEVLAPLDRGDAVAFHPWDCHAGRFADDVVTVDPSATPVVLVEGSYALHPDLRRYYRLSVFLDISPEEQLRRLARRNPTMLQRFRDEWIPLEERYFEATGAREAADVVTTVDLRGPAIG